MKKVVVGIISRKRESGEEEYLLASSTKNFGEYTGYYYPPGGRIEEGESVAEALRRELREELSLTVEPKREIAITPGDVEGQETHWWACEIIGGEMRIDENEIADAGFYTRAEMDGMKIWPATRNFFYRQREQEQLRQTFDTDPILYDSARPYYPDSLFTQLLEVTRISQGASLLEIGLGTGRATMPLADRGFNITAIDIGSNMVKFAQQKFAQYTNVEVINASFEEIEFTKSHFDLIYSATAFHWIDPKVKYAKTHELLKDAGHLAIIGTEHVSDERGDEFFYATQPLYDKWIPSETNNEHRLPRAVDLLPEPFDKDLFDPIYFNTFSVRIDYDAVTYCELLGTFSDVLSLSKEAREGFLKEMAELIRGEFNNAITKHSVMSLSIARKI